MFPFPLFSPDSTERLTHFVRWSNLLSGIHREPNPAEVAAHRGFIAADDLRVENLLMFVHHVQRGAALRRTGKLPDGTLEQLKPLISAARDDLCSPDDLLARFRRLRPFTDANGRSGRVLWLWQTLRDGQQPAAIPSALSLPSYRHDHA